MPAVIADQRSSPAIRFTPGAMVSRLSTDTTLNVITRGRIMGQSSRAGLTVGETSVIGDAAGRSARWLEQFDTAGGVSMHRAGQSGVGGEQGGIQRFRERDVGGVIGGQVVAQLPDAG